MLFNIQMLESLIKTVTENPLAGGFVLICSLIGMCIVAQAVVNCAEALRKK